MSSSEEIHLILNPTAGRGRAAALRPRISRFFEERGARAVWHVTRRPGHASQIVGELPPGLPAVAGTGRPMGVLPAGSGNDYVKALGIGGDLRRAMEVVLAGEARAVDAGEVNGEFFDNGLGIGFDAEVAAGVVKAPAYLGGAGRYMWSVARLLWGFTCHPARLSFDDGTAVESETILVAVALGTTYGARFRLAPEARLDDGAFDVVWSDRVSRAEVIRLIPSALRGTLLRHPKVHMHRAREVEVKLGRVVPAHVDGEILPPTRLFRARVLPGALRVLAPRG